MQRFLAFLLLLLPATMMAAKYDGVYQLQEALDENSVAVNIPGKFNLVLRSESDETNYEMSLRIGNALRAHVQITSNEEGGGADELKIGPIMSTMMMPPEDLYRLEQYMSKSLPTMTSIEFGVDDEKLTISGDGATSAVFEKELD